MLWYQYVMCNVDKQLVLLERFKSVSGWQRLDNLTLLRVRECRTGMLQNALSYFAGGGC